MGTRVGINGFGRMGRLVLKAGWGSEDLEFVHINEPFGGLEGAAHLLEFDSVHGRWNRNIRPENEKLRIDDTLLSFSEKTAPDNVPWKERGIDIVLECSGKFRTKETLEPYLAQGVRKVIVSAPVKEGMFNIVVGCNDE